uniref:legumain n=1 Tax=Rhipicephalus pulchellus TaxID=72859 RepID=L7M9F1_RHIPC
MPLSWCLFISLAALTSTFAAAFKKSAKNGYDNQPKLWALLVAGSKGYSNYRHQADVCHAYHVLHDHGVPDERIVVMMYDDIAHARENPTPGMIINHPNGTDVYRGVPKDYTGDLVTPQNFLDILQGKKVKGGSGKVIHSKPIDHVFLYFAGHGAPGLLAFPNGVLHAQPFMNVIKSLNKKTFASMTIYVEACESGSIFDGLLTAYYSVYATTAANPYESSYACYYDAKREAYLGNLYSVSWMEDSDKKDLKRETLFEQFSIVKKMTYASHVMEYGNLPMRNLSLSQFQGKKETSPIVLPKAPDDIVSSRDVPIAILRHKLGKASNPQEMNSLKAKLRRALSNRLFLKNKVAEIASFVARGKSNDADVVLSSQRKFTKFDCYQKAVGHFNDRCFELSQNPYAFQHLRAFMNMCELSYNIFNITEAMDLLCTHPTFVGIV